MNFNDRKLKGAIANIGIILAIGIIMHLTFNYGFDKDKRDLPSVQDSGKVSPNNDSLLAPATAL